MLPADNSFLPSTRREFLRRTGKGLGLLAFSHAAPRFLTESALAQVPAPEKDRSILVLIQLAGGNDGLNTVVPFEDERYFRMRPRLALDKREILPVSDQLGFHPACSEMAGLFKDGKLSIVQNVGYPNPNRSHFRSSEIWETASDSDQTLSTGWLGRFFDNTCPGSPDAPCGIHISEQTPQAFFNDSGRPVFGVDPRRARRRVEAGDTENLLDAFSRSPGNHSDNLSFLQHTLMDALVTEDRVRRILGLYRPAAAYPQSRLALALQQVAGLIAAGLETRVFFVSQTGYDTHANQLTTHQRLLSELSQAVAAFQKDLEAHRLQDQVLTMTFSEFGRRPGENAGGGTDHGTAAPLFVMGNRLQAPILGSPPDLDIGKNQDLRFSTDFRQVYASVIREWFGANPTPVLGDTFPGISLVS